jgi:hypothetical protein
MADVEELQTIGPSPFEQKASENMLQKGDTGKAGERRQDMSSTEESGGDEGDDEAEGDKGGTAADEEEVIQLMKLLNSDLFEGQESPTKRPPKADCWS